MEYNNIIIEQYDSNNDKHHPSFFMRVHLTVRPWPNMLKFLPIMLLSSAQISYPFCSFCSIAEIFSQITKMLGKATYKISKLQVKHEPSYIPLKVKNWMRI